MKGLTHRILFTREAKKTIDKLDPTVRKLVRNAIESLAGEPEKGKPLSQNLSGLRSLRTSDYRIIYRWRSGELLVLVIAIGHRGDVYKRLAELLSLAGKTT